MNEVAVQGSQDISLTLSRGLRILEMYSPTMQVITTTEAADGVGISRAAARRLLLTLAELGYLKQEKGSFRLTPKVLSIGQGILAREDRWLQAASFIVDASNRMDEPFSLSVLDGLRIRFVARDLKRRIHSARLMVGDTLPAHCSAAGKVLLSALSDEDVGKLLEEKGPLERRTPNTIADLAPLLAELRQVRLKSWAIADDEMEIGTIGIAVPVFDETGAVIAALAVGSHKKRRTVAELSNSFLPVLVELSERISSS